jgi:hypothetical protein
MIRSVTPGDLWVLRRKPRNQVVLYNERLLARPHQPFWFASRCFFEGNSQDRTTSVFHDRGVRAVAQARGRAGRPEQDIVYLGVYGSDRRTLPSDYDIWYRLLEQLTVTAGHNHTQRLYASLWSQQAEAHEIFRQLGFQAYLRRIVLQLSGPDWDQGTTLAPMHGQSRADAWGIHKLYGSVAPRIVQHAEVRTPRSWGLPLAQRWQQTRRRGWVLGSHDDVSAYLHMRSGPAAHVLTLLLHPAAREVAPDVLRFGLTQISDDKPVYLILAEYLSELLAPVQNLGFQPVGEQTMWMKSTAVTMRQPVRVSAFEPGIEPRITIPHISVPREDAHTYARPTRNYD